MFLCDLPTKLRHPQHRAPKKSSQIAALQWPQHFIIPPSHILSNTMWDIISHGIQVIYSWPGEEEGVHQHLPSDAWNTWLWCHEKGRIHKEGHCRSPRRSLQRVLPGGSIKGLKAYIARQCKQRCWWSAISMKLTPWTMCPLCRTTRWSCRRATSTGYAHTTRGCTHKKLS